MIALAENIGKLLAPLEEYADVFACRIRAMSRLYWKNQEILFYTNSINSSFYVESGNAVVWISPHSTAKDKAELCDLLAVTARTVRGQSPAAACGLYRNAWTYLRRLYSISLYTRSSGKSAWLSCRVGAGLSRRLFRRGGQSALCRLFPSYPA